MQNTLILLPIIVAAITLGIKKLPSIVNAAEPTRTAIIRVIVLVLSFATVVLTALLNGTSVDQSIISDFVQTLFVALSATGLYVISK